MHWSVEEAAVLRGEYRRDQPTNLPCRTHLRKHKLDTYLVYHSISLEDRCVYHLQFISLKTSRVCRSALPTDPN